MFVSMQMRDLLLVPLVPKEQRVPGRFIDAALEHSGVSAKDAAERLGVTAETVSRWRRDVVAFSNSQWIALRSVLKLPTNWEPPKSFKPKAPTRGRPRRRR